VIRRLAPAIWLAVTASQIAAAPARAQADAPTPGIDEKLVQPTALDGVGITTAPAAKGLVFRLDATQIVRGPSLRADFSLASLKKYETVNDLTEAHERETFNWRNIAIFGEAAPLERDGAVTDELGNWRVGIKWALHDETSLFRPAAVRALMKAGANALETIVSQESLELREEQDKLWEQMRDRTATILDQAFTQNCYGTDPFADAKQGWKWELPESPLSRSLDQAREVCKARNSSAIAEARKAVIDGMLAEVEKWTDTLGCPTTGGVSLAFPVLKRDVNEWQKTWEPICRPKLDAAMAAATAAVAKMKERLTGGLVLSAEASLVGAALAGMDGDARPTTARDYYGNLTLQLGYRYFWKHTALDLAFFPIRDVIDLEHADAPPAYAVAANLELGRGKYWGSSVIVSLDAEADRFSRDTADRRYELEQRVAVPLREKAFLHLGLRQVYAQGQGWDTSISLALAWSFEQDGKELARQIELKPQN
jgi:hypothetical protein